MKQAEIDRYQQDWLVSKCYGGCLHIGSGMKPIRGAVNLDPDPNRRQWADVAGVGLALPFVDGGFDTVVSSHVLPCPPKAMAYGSPALRRSTRAWVGEGVA